MEEWGEEEYTRATDFDFHIHTHSFSIIFINQVQVLKTWF